VAKRVKRKPRHKVMWYFCRKMKMLLGRLYCSSARNGCISVGEVEF